MFCVSCVELFPRLRSKLLMPKDESRHVCPAFTFHALQYSKRSRQYVYDSTLTPPPIQFPSLFTSCLGGRRGCCWAGVCLEEEGAISPQQFVLLALMLPHRPFLAAMCALCFSDGQFVPACIKTRSSVVGVRIDFAPCRSFYSDNFHFDFLAFRMR